MKPEPNIKRLCGCEYAPSGALIHKCSGHPHVETLQRAKRCSVVPIREKRSLLEVVKGWVKKL